MNTITRSNRGLQTATRALALGLGLALSLSSAQAAPTATKFDAATTVQGSALQLNGKGTRYKVVFKIYDMALYTTKRVETPGELLTLVGPKKLAFTALREIPGTDLGRLFIRGMSDNATPEQMLHYTPATNRLIEIFSGKNRLVPGDTFAMEFMPGKGTTFYIQGHPQGSPVGDDEFFGLVLRIWVGNAPADWKLRDALLDGAKE
jgi:hypothetical protein